MSTTETKDEKKTIEIPRGFVVRTFDGEIAADEKKKTPSIPFKYERAGICPWNRTGKDSDGKEVVGAVPSMSEVLAWVHSKGFTTEFKLNSDGKPETESAIGFLLDGINSYLNSTARAAALNTPESVKEKSIAMFMKIGMTRQEAIDYMKNM